MIAADVAALGRLELPPIRGVVHAAGIVENMAIRNLSEESLRRVMRPKVRGALLLHERFPPGSLDFFVLFSSAGHLLGMPGQAAYGAANAFLDGLARHRRALGDAGALAVAWTSWRGLGLSTSSAAIDAELRARGAADITSEEAFATWNAFGLGPPGGNLAVLRMLPGPTTRSGTPRATCSNRSPSWPRRHCEPGLTTSTSTARWPRWAWTRCCPSRSGPAWSGASAARSRSPSCGTGPPSARSPATWPSSKGVRHEPPVRR